MNTSKPTLRKRPVVAPNVNDYLNTIEEGYTYTETLIRSYQGELTYDDGCVDICALHDFITLLKTTNKKTYKLILPNYEFYGGEGSSSGVLWNIIIGWIREHNVDITTSHKDYYKSKGARRFRVLLAKYFPQNEYDDDGEGPMTIPDDFTVSTINFTPTDKQNKTNMIYYLQTLYDAIEKIADDAIEMTL